MKINIVKMTRDLADYYRRVKEYRFWFGNGWFGRYDTPMVIADVVEIVAKSCERK